MVLPIRLNQSHGAEPPVCVPRQRRHGVDLFGNSSPVESVAGQHLQSATVGFHPIDRDQPGAQNACNDEFRNTTAERSKYRGEFGGMVSAGIRHGRSLKLPHGPGSAYSGGHPAFPPCRHLRPTGSDFGERRHTVGLHPMANSQPKAQRVSCDKTEKPKNRKERYVLADCFNTGSSLGAWVVERLHSGRGCPPPARGRPCHDAIRVPSVVAATGVNRRREHHLQDRRQRFRFPLPAGGDRKSRT